MFDIGYVILYELVYKTLGASWLINGLSWQISEALRGAFSLPKISEPNLILRIAQGNNDSLELIHRYY